MSVMEKNPILFSAMQARAQKTFICDTDLTPAQGNTLLALVHRCPLVGIQLSQQHQISTLWVKAGTRTDEIQKLGTEQHIGTELPSCCQGQLLPRSQTQKCRQGTKKHFRNLCYRMKPSPVIKEHLKATGSPTPSKSSMPTCRRAATPSVNIFRHQQLPFL